MIILRTSFSPFELNALFFSLPMINTYILLDMFKTLNGSSTVSQLPGSPRILFVGHIYLFSIMGKLQVIVLHYKI